MTTRRGRGREVLLPPALALFYAVAVPQKNCRSKGAAAAAVGGTYIAAATKSDSCFPFFCVVSNFFMGLKSSSRIFRAVLFGGLVRRDAARSGSVRFGFAFSTTDLWQKERAVMTPVVGLLRAFFSRACCVMFLHHRVGCGWMAPQIQIIVFARRR